MRTRYLLIDLDDNPFQLLLLTEWCAGKGKAMYPEHGDDNQLFVYVKVSDGQYDEMKEYIASNSPSD